MQKILIVILTILTLPSLFLMAEKSEKKQPLLQLANIKYRKAIDNRDKAAKIAALNDINNLWGDSPMESNSSPKLHFNENAKIITYDKNSSAVENANSETITYNSRNSPVKSILKNTSKLSVIKANPNIKKRFGIFLGMSLAIACCGYGISYINTFGEDESKKSRHTRAWNSMTTFIKKPISLTTIAAAIVSAGYWINKG